MQIEREKFFALTARLAGFWPTEACAAGSAGARGRGAERGAERPASSEPPEPSPDGLAGAAICAKLRR